MSHISSSFLYRFLDDVWDLLPTEDRSLFEAYWKGQIRIAANMQSKVIEASQSIEISEVPVFLSERWNRFVMDDDTTDQSEQVDAMTLLLTAPIKLTRETALFDTLLVTNSSGKIFHEETIRLFDESSRNLRYNKLVAGTISVKLDGFEFTPNRDFVINETDGVIQALVDGRIPADEILTVNYFHDEYTKDLDYQVDESNYTVSRTDSSAIASGDTVYVRYTYNATATLQLVGLSAKVDGAVLTDDSKNFSTLLPGRTLIISDGDNAGTYQINSILGKTQLQISTLFPSAQETGITYSINAFPHGIKIDSNIDSIPVLQNRVDNPEYILIEDVDYIISGGLLSSKSPFIRSTIGPGDLQIRQAWAEVTKVNKETPYRNFGVLIDFYRENSEEYRLALQGLWFTFWTGSTPGNLGRGLHILLGLPFARRAGTVTRVDTDLGEIDVTETNGRIITYTIPSGLDPTTERWDEVSRFDSLTTGVEITDRNNSPGFVANNLGRSGISQFLTDSASRGVGDTDETRALTLLENHLFIPSILVEAIAQRVNVTELTTFLDNMKPQWTEYVLSFSTEDSEVMSFSEETPPPELSIDLTTTVDNNECNRAAASGQYYIHEITGEIIGGGSQATGNFRDLTQNFVTLGIDEGDTVRIDSGLFVGHHAVLERQSSDTLSLDIPDALLQSVIALEYFVLTEEQCRLDHDSIQLRKENTLLLGADHPTPTVLNTKTDIDLGGLSMTNDEVKALLLVDIGNPGAEVQAITAADTTLNEFDVGVSPGTVTRAHEVSSAALLRTDNTGPTVTDAYAI